MPQLINRWMLSCGFLLACNSEPSETTGSASQTGSATQTGSTGGVSATGPTATGTAGATEAGSGGVTEGGGGTTVIGTSGDTAGGDTEVGTTAADLCAGYKPPGCKKNSCADGEECKVVESMCVPTACTCDPATGEEACSEDCGGGSCVPVCPDIQCDIDCVEYKTDANGCQLCECVDGPPPVDCVCKTDKDCVKTSSGCCGCNEGGDEVPAHVDCVDQVKMCDLPPDQVICPQVYLCTDVQPVCVAGMCQLL